MVPKFNANIRYKLNLRWDQGKKIGIKSIFYLNPKP